MIGRALALAAALAATGCLDALGPDVGPPLRELCVNEDSDPTVRVDYQTDIVLGIFRRPDLHCLRCHNPEGNGPIGVLVGGLDLTSYEGLRAGGAQGGTDIVVPGQPCDSILYQKTEAGPPFGGRMPLDGPPYLSEQDEQVLADWIAEGALAQ